MNYLKEEITLDHIEDTHVRSESNGSQIVFMCPNCGGKASYNIDDNIGRCFTCPHPTEPGKTLPIFLKDPPVNGEFQGVITQKSKLNPDDLELLSPLQPETYCYLESRGLKRSTYSRFNLYQTTLGHDIVKLGWKHYGSQAIELRAVTLEDTIQKMTVGSPKTFSLFKLVDEPSEIVICEGLISGMSYAQCFDKFDVWCIVLNSLSSIPALIQNYQGLTEELQLSKVYLALDHDDAGLKGTDNLKKLFSSCSMVYSDHTPLYEGKDWNDVLVQNLEAKSIQDKGRYLTSGHIKKSLEDSLISGKVSVIPDFPGTGKTEASTDLIIENHVDGVLFVAEKKSTIDRIYETLLTRGLTKSDVGVYHGDSVEEMEEVYKANGSKLVSLVTHKRIMIDPLHLWLTVSKLPNGQLLSTLSRKEQLDLILKSNIFKTNKKWVIIDEQPELIEHAHLESKNFVKLLKDTELEKPFNRALNGDLFTVKEVKKLIANSTNDLFINASHYLDVYSAGNLNQEKVLNSLGIIKWENSRYLGSFQNTDKNRARVLFLIRKVIGAVLTSRANPFSPLSDVLVSTLLTPLTDFNVGVAILDGSAIFNRKPIESLYCGDFFKVQAPTTKPTEAEIKIKIIDSPFSKKSVLKMNDISSFNLYGDYLNTLISLGRRYGKTRYFVSYKDKVTSTDSSAAGTSSEDILEMKEEKNDVINDQIEFIGAVKRILEERNEVFTCLNKDLPNYGIDQSSPSDWYLSYYGLTKGSNSLGSCDTVILQGGYFLNHRAYSTQKDFSKSEHDFKFEQVSNFALQELMRSRLRRGKDVTLIIGNDSETGELAPWIDYLLVTLRENYVVQMINETTEEEEKLKLNASRVLLPQIYNKLRPTQIELFNRLLGKYQSKLLSDSSLPDEFTVEIDLKELAAEWDERTDKLLAKLRRLSENSNGILQLQETNRSNSRSESTTIQMWIERNLS
jgi:hypothetical protein